MEPAFSTDQMTNPVPREVLIWDTSAINGLAKVSNRRNLIAKLSNTGVIHRIPMYVFDEVAATQNEETRTLLLKTCRELKGDSEMIILLSPWRVIEAGIRMFWEVGTVDWEILLGPIAEYEEALESGRVFDQELAKIQKKQNRDNLKRFEDYVVQSKAQFAALFQANLDRSEAVDDFVHRANATDLVRKNARYYCQAVLRTTVESRDLERFLVEFPPMRANIYAFLLAHYERNRSAKPSSPAGAIDLLASVYLPLCHKFVTDDQEQQKVLREVTRCCSLLAEVVWFSGALEENCDRC